MSGTKPEADVIEIKSPPGEIPGNVCDARDSPSRLRALHSLFIITTTIIYSSYLYLCKLTWPKEAILTTFSKFVNSLVPQALCSLAHPHAGCPNWRLGSRKVVSISTFSRLILAHTFSVLQQKLYVCDAFLFRPSIDPCGKCSHDSHAMNSISRQSRQLVSSLPRAQ